MAKVLLDLEKPAAWPIELQFYLDKHHDLFLGWEESRVAAKLYDNAIHGLVDALIPYNIVGWHCTRLTELEINVILNTGMQLPDADMLTRRVDALLDASLITADNAQRLKNNNQCNKANRKGKIWFCFYHPLLAGESGIERFFRHWGGEALYNSHERDPITSPAISCIGTSCVVEANVPIAALEYREGLSMNIVRRFLISRGFKTEEPTEYEGRINRLLPAENIEQVVRFPDPVFLSLTGCSEWRRPIRQ